MANWPRKWQLFLIGDNVGSFNIFHASQFLSARSIPHMTHVLHFPQGHIAPKLLSKSWIPHNKHNSSLPILCCRSIPTLTWLNVRTARLINPVRDHSNEINLSLFASNNLAPPHARFVYVPHSVACSIAAHCSYHTSASAIMHTSTISARLRGRHTVFVTTNAGAA